VDWVYWISPKKVEKGKESKFIYLEKLKLKIGIMSKHIIEEVRLMFRFEGLAFE